MLSHDKTLSQCTHTTSFLSCFPMRPSVSLVFPFISFPFSLFRDFLSRFNYSPRPFHILALFLLPHLSRCREKLLFFSCFLQGCFLPLPLSGHLFFIVSAPFSLAFRFVFIFFEIFLLFFVFGLR